MYFSTMESMSLMLFEYSLGFGGMGGGGGGGGGRRSRRYLKSMIVAMKMTANLGKSHLIPCGLSVREETIIDLLLMYPWGLR